MTTMSPDVAAISAVTSQSQAARVDMSYTIDIGGVRRRVELPFVVAVLADLSGTPAEPLPALADRRLNEVDADSFDALVAMTRPRLAFVVPNVLGGGGDLAIDLTFESMDDFGPLSVAQQVESVRRLLLSRPPGHEADERLDAQLNIILHHDDFRQLEGTWRGLQRLVTRTEIDDLVSIRVMDCTKKELGRSLKKFRGTAWDQSPMFKRFYDEGYSLGRPFGLLVGDYQFDHSPQDTQLLGDIAQLAAACFAPFVAAAAPSVLQMESWVELNNPRDLSKIFQTPEYAAWRSLQESEDARYVALALPRFLARAPYGPGEGKPGRYAFRECLAVETSPSGWTDPPPLVWSNAAFLMAETIIRSFQTHGWPFHITGLATGGAVEDLAECDRAPLPSAPRASPGVEVEVHQRREAELRRSGLIGLVARTEPGMAEFASARSLQRPQNYNDPDASAAALAAADLPHVLSLCRLHHHVRCMMNDGMLPRDNPAVATALFDAWIDNYIVAAAGTSGAINSARPLLAVSIIFYDANEDTMPSYILRLSLK